MDSYEKAYKEALEKAKYWHKEGYGKGCQEVVEDIFSELKESEDEKIRKALINGFNKFDKSAVWYNGITNGQILAWLEKQKEPELSEDLGDYIAELSKQFPEVSFAKLSRIAVRVRNWLEKQGEIDNVPLEGSTNTIITDSKKPKFKVGDWIVCEELNTALIVNVDDGRYEVEFIDGNKGFPHIEYVDRNFHLWTIQDAKDGDVLVNGSNIFIFHFINDTRLMGYCHVNTDDGRFYDDIGKNECFCLIDAVVNPATKEQRDLLFQKMKETGYEWDSEKKKLIIDYPDSLPKDSWELVHEFVEKFRRIPTDEDELTALVEYVLKRQKLAWSEEDSFRTETLISVIKSGGSIRPELRNEFVNWLKSLKERIGD